MTNQINGPRCPGYTLPFYGKMDTQYCQVKFLKPKILNFPFQFYLSFPSFFSLFVSLLMSLSHSFLFLPRKPPAIDCHKFDIRDEEEGLGWEHLINATGVDVVPRQWLGITRIMVLNAKTICQQLIIHVDQSTTPNNIANADGLVKKLGCFNAEEILLPIY